MNRLLTLLLILLSFAAPAKPPNLTPSDVKTTLEELLKNHATCKKFTPEIVERVLINFLEELDPVKGYLLEKEISTWLTPQEGTVQGILQDLKRGNYSQFQQMHALLEPAIIRRNEIEEEISQLPLPSAVDSEEFKELTFSKTKEELANRHLRIKALQSDAAKRLNEENQDFFLQRIQKKRINRELELWSSNSEDREKLVLATLLKATASALDAHTNYFTPSEAGQFLIQVQQRLFGIGAQLRDNLNGFSVVRILENSPASQSKLKMNDRIVAVGHEPIVGLDITEAVELIRGEQGTPVVLTVLREGTEGTEKLDIELIRNEVVLEESRVETQIEAFGDGVIAYLRLFSFYQDQSSSSAQDLRKSIESIKKDHQLLGVVLDLRDNAGGLLPQAVAVTGLFITKGIVVSIKDNAGKLQHLRETEGRPAWDGPLTVLVNRASASAAEIVAQALQDYGRAIILGDDHTFGKGTFQTFTLDATHTAKVNPKGEYKVTRGRYYTVSGKSPQLTGVLSDIKIPGILSSFDIGEKFAKFPIANDEIESHFDDDLSDISPIHRLQFGPMYRYNLQAKLDTYAPFMDTLQKNSELRIKGDKNYQRFLAELGKKDFDPEPIELFNLSDPQLAEALKVMKDLIFLTARQHSAA